jgi:hypothetical protein
MIMKKFMTFLTVLLMANVAFGLPYIFVTVLPEEGDPYIWEGQDVHPSDIIVIDFYDDNPEQYPAAGFADFVLAASNGEAIDWWHTETGDNGYGWWGVPWVETMSQYYEGPEGQPSGFEWNFTAMGATALGDPTGYLWSVSIHVPWYKVESDWIIVDHTFGSWHEMYPGELVNEFQELLFPIAIHVIPEPMTIALLGLGGLFLVRRRR